VSDDTPFADAWRRVIDANVRYYQALGQVTADYVSAVSTVWRGVPLPFSFALPALTPRGREMSAPKRAPDTPVETTSAHASAPTLVLETSAGQEARAAFAISNGLPRQVTAPVMVSALRGEDGTELRPTMRVVPGALSLAPGEKAVVQLHVLIDDTLTPGVGYYGTITVPDLSSERIPIVVRRLTTPAAEPVAQGAAAPIAAAARRPPKGKKGAGRARRTPS